MKTDKVTITKEQLDLFVRAGKAYCSTLGESIIKANIEEILDVAIKKLKKVERQAEMYRLKYAKKTSSKHIDRDKHGNYQFTEEDMNSLQNDLDAMNEELVTLPCLIVEKKDIPDDLSYDLRNAFAGIVLPKKSITIEFEDEDEKSNE